MKNYKTYLLAISVFLVSACAPQMSAVWKQEGYAPSRQGNLAVVSISNDLEVRSNVEAHLKQELGQSFPNYKLISGTSILPPQSNKSEWSEENLTKLLQQLDVHTVLTSSVVNSYVVNRTVSDIEPMYPRPFVSVGVGYNMNRYYNTAMSMDYSVPEQKYVIETNLYELKSNGRHELVWRGQSKVSNPHSVAQGASHYADNVVAYLAKEQLL